MRGQTIAALGIIAEVRRDVWRRPRVAARGGVEGADKIPGAEAVSLKPRALAGN
ncbi:hypothetical protein CCP2SC5_1130007 [Azospirillaceae bacterium]